MQADQVGLRDLAEEIGHAFVKMIVAGFRARGAADGANAQAFAGPLLDDFQGRLGFINENFAGLVAHGHLEMKGHLGGG